MASGTFSNSASVSGTRLEDARLITSDNSSGLCAGSRKPNNKTGSACEFPAPRKSQPRRFGKERFSLRFNRFEAYSSRGVERPARGHRSSNFPVPVPHEPQIPRAFRRLPLCWPDSSRHPTLGLRAGAAAVDVTPKVFPDEHARRF